MIDSISNAAQDRAQDTLGVTIALAQGFPSLRCERSRRPACPGSPPCIHAEDGINHLYAARPGVAQMASVTTSIAPEVGQTV
jgi:hypothetical protein